MPENDELQNGTAADPEEGTGTGTETGAGSQDEPQEDGPQAAIAALALALSASGVDFVRDTWIDENNDMGRSDYGVVTLTGSPEALWGDDRMIAQRMNGNVYLYVMDGDDAKALAVQNILITYPGLSFALAGCEFLKDLVANRWTWRFTLEEYF